MADESHGAGDGDGGFATFLGLRSIAMTVAPSDIGMPDDTTVFGVVMDTTYESGTATLVALADGTVSLYMSSGSGIIGGGGHAQIAAAGRQAIEVAADHLAEFGPASAGTHTDTHTDTDPHIDTDAHTDEDTGAHTDEDTGELPPDGWTRITLRTHAGDLTVTAPEDDFGYGRHPAAPVFHAVHRVIAELRTLEDGPDGQPGPPPADFVGPDGSTALMSAAHLGDMRAAADIIGLGKPVDARDDDGYTALMYAANAGHDDLVRLLLDSGADPDARDSQDSTPLMFAAQGDHLGIVSQLLAAGADVHVRGTHGLTALGFARQNGHSETAAALTSAGAT